MAKNKKIATVLSTAAITGLITAAVGSTAFAKTSGVLLNNGSNDYKYDLSSLQKAFDDNQMDSTKGVLYQDYASKLASGSVVGLYDDTQAGKVIDYSKVAAAFSAAQLNGTTFDLNAYTQASTSYVTPTAPIYDQAVGTDGKLTSTIEQNTLAVSSVSNVNLKSFTVTFNQAIDNTNTLSTDTLKVYKNGSATAEAYTTSVSADKTKVTVALTNQLSQGDQLRVVVNGVKNAAGSVVTPYDATQTVSDTLQPSFVSLTATTAKNIDVVFNKPVNLTNGSKVWDNFYVDGIKTYATATVDPTTNKVSLQLASNLAAGSHTFKVTGVRDFAGFLATDATGSFNVSIDTTAPAVTSVTAVGKNEVKVVFSEPLSSLGTVTIGSSAVAFSDGDITTAVSYGAKGVIKEADNVTYDFYLPSGSYLNANDILGSKVNYKGTTDVSGNQVDTTNGVNFAFTAPNDSTVPTVTSTVVTADSSDGTWKKNDVKLVFSKDMDTNEVTNTANYVLKRVNSDGTTTTLTVPTISTVDSKTYKISLSGVGSVAVAGGKYTLEYNPSSALASTLISDTSIRTNTLANKVDTLVFLDEKQPTMNSITLIQPAQAGTASVAAKPAIIRVAFDEAMDNASLTNAANYIIGISTSAKTLDQIPGVTLTASSDNKSVDITIPQAVCPTITVNSTDLTVLNVKDAAGNSLTNFNTPNPISGVSSFDNTNQAIATSTLAVTGKRTLVWTLDTTSVGATDRFALIDPNELVVKNQATSTIINGLQVASAQLNSDGSVVTLTLNQDLNADGTYTYTDPSGAKSEVKLSLGTVPTVANSKDVNGAVLSLATFNIVAADDVAPTLTSAKVTVNGVDMPVAMSADGKTGTIDLSNVSGSVTDLKVSASESGKLTLVSPATNSFLNASENVSTGVLDIHASATLSQLQSLAKLDGDGDDNTLTITGILQDNATVANKSAVVLKIKVK